MTPSGLKGICQLKKLPANEITEPRPCVVKVRGKAIVLQSRFRRTRFGPVVNKLAKQKESNVQQIKKKPRRNCRSVILGALDGREILN